MPFAASCEVRGDEQQPRALGRVEQRELVLAEHVAAHEADDPADLAREQHAARGAQRPGERALAGPAELLDERVERAAHRAQVGLRPGRAVDRLGRRQLVGGLEARVGDDAHARVPRHRVEVAGQRLRGLAVGRAGDGARDALGEAPVDHE